MAATQPLAATLRTGALRVAAAPDAQGGVFQRTIRYGYDDLNRVTGAQESGSTANTFTYAYDQTGNRTDGGKTYDAANQVTGWAYDAAGNLTNDGVTTDERRTTNDERGLGCP
jgi:YD repeat-containing protein